MKTSPIQIVRSDISTNFACPLLVYLYCLQMLTYLRQYNNTVYSHVQYTVTILSATTTDSYSANVFLPVPTTQHHNAPQHHSAQNIAINIHLSTVPRHTKT